MPVWIALLVAIVLVAVILALLSWVTGGRETSDEERRASWSRGPNDGGAGGSLGL